MDINFLSLMNYQNITTSNNEISKSLSKLSSGIRITQSSIDVSGLAISDNLRTQASSLSKALDNTNSAIAMAQLADKAMAEQSNIIDIVRQKLLQASTQTTSNEGKQSILKDIKKLLQQYDAIASTTNFNGITLLQQSPANMNMTDNIIFQTGSDNKSTVSFGSIQSNTSFGGIGQVDKIIISGDIKKYDVFAVNINGKPIHYVADDEDVGNTSEKHNLVATKLMNKLLASTDNIQVENTASGEITITAETLGAYLTYSQGTATFDNSFYFSQDVHYPPTTQTYTMTIGGIIESGDTFTIGAASYTVQNETSAYQVAKKLVSVINALPYPDATASLVSTFPAEIKLTANTPGSPFINPIFYTQNAAANNDQAISTGVVIQENVIEILEDLSQGIIYQAPVAKQVQYSLSGTVQAGDKFIIGNKTYTVQTDDTSIDNIVDKLISGINGSTMPGYCCGAIAGVTSSKDSSGNLILTANVPGVDFTTPTASTIGVGINNQSITQSTIRPPVENSYETYDKYYTVSGIVKDGNTFTIGTASYTIQSLDMTTNDIINGLVKAVNGISYAGVSGTALPNVEARNESGKLVIRSIINPVPDFAINATNNMSNISVSELDSNISIVGDSITFISNGNKYRQYSEELRDNDIDEQQTLVRENVSMADSLLVLKNLWELDAQTAQYFVSIADKALSALNGFRSDYGSLQNQMEAISRSLMNRITNTKNAESVIRDVDYASEVSNLNKNQIISQSASFTQERIKERHQEIIKLIDK